MRLGDGETCPTRLGQPHPQPGNGRASRAHWVPWASRGRQGTPEWGHAALRPATGGAAEAQTGGSRLTWNWCAAKKLDAARNTFFCGAFATAFCSRELKYNIFATVVWYDMEIGWVCNVFLLFANFVPKLAKKRALLASFFGSKSFPGHFTRSGKVFH